MTQHTTACTSPAGCCELLSNLYLCIGWHSVCSNGTTPWSVVNCFQICIFVSDDTARGALRCLWNLLWIAFKFVSLYRMTQLEAAGIHIDGGCELLSNLYLCIGWHSLSWVGTIHVVVVNCFQICIFVSDDTAIDSSALQGTQLWIAFKFVSLYRMTQPYCWRGTSMPCCELLSNLYLCIGWHSVTSHQPHRPTVVNCFQICIFVSDDTASDSVTIDQIVLWIAFKFVSLYRMTQHSNPKQTKQFRCELLSNLYLCIGWHSWHEISRRRIVVVNCFQICIFVSDDTASRSMMPSTSWLWIAFKFVSLYRMTQL